MTKVKSHKRRNPVARHLHLHKGGVHEKSNSAKRQKQKRNLNKEIATFKAGNAGLESFITLGAVA